jgi:hypothetical protein
MKNTFSCYDWGQLPPAPAKYIPVQHIEAQYELCCIITFIH